MHLQASPRPWSARVVGVRRRPGTSVSLVVVQKCFLVCTPQSVPRRCSRRRPRHALLCRTRCRERIPPSCARSGSQLSAQGRGNDLRGRAPRRAPPAPPPAARPRSRTRPSAARRPAPRARGPPPRGWRPRRARRRPPRAPRPARAARRCRAAGRPLRSAPRSRAPPPGQRRHDFLLTPRLAYTELPHALQLRCYGA